MFFLVCSTSQGSTILQWHDHNTHIRTILVLLTQDLCCTHSGHQSSIYALFLFSAPTACTHFFFWFSFLSLLCYACNTWQVQSEKTSTTIHWTREDVYAAASELTQVLQERKKTHPLVPYMSKRGRKNKLDRKYDIHCKYKYPLTLNCIT